MNDTKWQELFDLFKNNTLKVSFRRFDLFEPRLASRWETELNYVFGGWEVIERLEVSAKEKRRRGQLLDDAVIDRTEELLALARTIDVPFSLVPEGICYWGYLRPGISPEWYESGR